VKFRHRSVVRLAPRIDDNGPLRAQQIEMQTNGLSHSPFDAIAYNGFTERSRHGESDTRTVAGGFADTKSSEERPTMAGTLVINSSEILRSQQTDTFRKTRDVRTTSRR
jgi:hypothetical protein